MLRENESLLKANESLNHEKEKLLKNKDLADNQIAGLSKSVEAVQKDLKDRENQVFLSDCYASFTCYISAHVMTKENINVVYVCVYVYFHACVYVCIYLFFWFFYFQIQVLKQSWERQRKELNDCRSEITSLKMHIEGSRSGKNLVASDVDAVQSQFLEKYKEEIKSLQLEIERLKEKITSASQSTDTIYSEKVSLQTEELVGEIDENKAIISHPVDMSKVSGNDDVQPLATDNTDKHEEVSQDLLKSQSNENGSCQNSERVYKQNGELTTEDSRLHLKLDSLSGEAASENTASSYSCYRTYLFPLPGFLFYFGWIGTSHYMCTLQLSDNLYGAIS